MEATQVAKQAANTQDPFAGLKAVASLHLLAETLEFRQVETALRVGLSWTQIAEALGVTRQAVHKKYAKRISPDIIIPRRRSK